MIDVTRTSSTQRPTSGAGTSNHEPRRQRRALLLTLAVAVLAGVAPGPARAGSSGRADAAALGGQLLDRPGVRQGLCLLLGCRSGALPVELSRQGRNVVHALAAEPELLPELRRYIAAEGLYGRVAVDWCPFDRLPYADAIADVIVVERFGELQEQGLAVGELVRVLAPYGTAFLRGFDGEAEGAEVSRAGEWTVLTKPYPAEADEWPQEGHDASRTSVSADRLVQPTTGLRWLAGEQWVPENVIASMGQAYSAAGRNFYLYMETREKRVRIVARNGFNGVLLWERQTQATGRLPFAAASDRVYTQIDKRGPIVALDAATGRVVRKYPFSARPLTLHNGTLIQGPGAAAAWSAETGERLWRSQWRERGVSAWDACVIGEGKVFAVVNERTEIGCLDLKTGRELWRVPRPEGYDLQFYADGILFARGAWSADRAVGHGASKRSVSAVAAFSAKDGRQLWSREPGQFSGPRRTASFLLNGLFWHYDLGDKDALVALDPTTGREKKRLELPAQRPWHRCFQERATPNYILGDLAMEFFDFRTGKHYGFYGSRGTCFGGWMPANGLVYTSQNPCRCFSQVRGVLAFSSDPWPALDGSPDAQVAPLEKGPAYDQAIRGAPNPPWPTFRHDATRGGITEAPVAADIKLRWRTRVGRGASSPILAEGKVFLSAVDEHRVVALDARTGERLWDRFVGGRVDSPPTYADGRLLFGSADGQVHCLRASDGERIWRLRAAPQDRRIVVHDQLESLWPVLGSVLVNGPTAYFAAGRHTELDGGILLYAADAATGRVIWRRVVAREDPLRRVGLLEEVRNASNRILTTDGRCLYMDKSQFDLATGKSMPEPAGLFLFGGNSGFLEDITRPCRFAKCSPRRQWAITDRPRGAVFKRETALAVGTSLAFGGERIYGIMNESSEIFALTVKSGRAAEKLWSVKTPAGSCPKSIVAAGDKVFVAASIGADESARGQLWILSADRGGRFATIALPCSPSFDGMAAAARTLYVVGEDEILSFGP